MNAQPKWTPPKAITGYESTTIPIPSTNGEPCINVCTAFKYQSHNLRENIILPADVYPPNWEDRAALEQAIINSALVNDGTQLVRGKTENMKHSYLICKHGKVYQAKKTDPTVDKENQAMNFREDRICNKDKASRGRAGLKGSKRAQSLRPMDKEERCKFTLRLTCVPGKHWMIQCKMACDCKHTGHTRIDSTVDRTSMSTLTQEQRDLAATVDRISPSGVTQKVMSEVTGRGTFSRQQLAYNTKKAEGKTSTEPKSDGEYLIAYLKAMVEAKKLRYVALFHEVTSTTLLAVDKYQARRKLQQMEEDVETYEDMELEGAEDITLSYEGGEICNGSIQLKSAKEKLTLALAIQHIRNDLVVGKKVLLAAAWSREDERLFFHRFPEVLMIDVTMGTNNQGRPLAVTCSPGPDMKTFVPMRCFLPSQCRWVFDWLFSSAIPLLLGRESLQRTQLVLSDGDPKIYHAFDDAQLKWYPNAKHGLCLFHLVTKPLKMLNSSLMYTDLEEVQDQLHTFKEWIFTFMRLGGVETEWEYKTSKHLMMEWLESFQKEYVSNSEMEARKHQAMKHNSYRLMEFFNTKVLPHKARWFFPTRSHLLHLQQKTTSALEGVNHTLKHKASKPVTPQMSLETSARTQYEIAETSMDETKKKLKRDFMATPTWTQSHQSRQLTTMGESLRIQVQSQAVNYRARLSPTKHNTVEVRRNEQRGIFCLECQNSETAQWCSTCSKYSPVPVFVRLRTLTITDVGEDMFTVECSCLHNDGHPC